MAKAAFLEIGEVVGTHGIAGEMRVQPWCDSAAAFCKLSVLYADAAGKTQFAVKSRPHKNIVLMKAAGVDTVQEAATWRGRRLFAARADMTLPDGRYFICDLIGCAVSDADTGEVYGHITAVSNNGAGDIYHMQKADGTLVLIPAIPAIVVAVDTDAESVRIRPMKGLFDA
jgi:16S rRNA processing protein RimM